jgi:hypothetical protein
VRKDENRNTLFEGVIASIALAPLAVTLGGQNLTTSSALRGSRDGWSLRTLRLIQRFHDVL